MHLRNLKGYRNKIQPKVYKEYFPRAFLIFRLIAAFSARLPQPRFIPSVSRTKTAETPCVWTAIWARHTSSQAEQWACARPSLNYPHLTPPPNPCPGLQAPSAVTLWCSSVIHNKPSRTLQFFSMLFMLTALATALNLSIRQNPLSFLGNKLNNGYHFKFL